MFFSISVQTFLYLTALTSERLTVVSYKNNFLFLFFFFSFADPDPGRMPIQSGPWIRIRNLDPDPGARKVENLET